MPARGTAAWRHAIVQKKIINMDHGGLEEGGSARHVMCAWDSCEKDGYQMYVVKVATHAEGAEERTMNYVFCNERHRQYWIHSARGQSCNNLPAGFKHLL